MAKKQTNIANKNQKPKQTKNNVVNKKNQKRELTKNEIMFFRIGVSVIAIGLVVAAIVMIVQSYLGNNEVNPYEDYLHFETEQLVAMTQKIDNTTYGDPDYFIGKSAYDDFRVILNNHEVFYFYFYNSSAINEDIQAEIEALTNIDELPLIFIDLEDSGNATLFEDANLSHLSLNQEADHMLLIYDMQPASTDEFFQLETNIDDIIAELGNI